MTEIPTLYYFDINTGEFIGAKPARMSPLEPDVPLVPRAATLVAPPEPVPGYARCWRDGKWEYVEDHRGQTVYSIEDGSERTIDTLGPLPDDVTTEPPPSPFHYWQDGQWVEDIEAARQAAINQFKVAIQAHIDATAQSKDYDDAKSLATYVNSTIPQWAAEAQVFVAWRDAVWAYALAELNKVLNGQRPQPTVEEFLTELPKIEWPE
jgi:hypothetical protein